MADTPRRLVSWFSCGAASAVATKMAIDRAGVLEPRVVYCEVKQEHPSNWDFLRACERWFGVDIEVLGNDAYGRDTDRVFRETKYLVGPSGARCTAELKKAVRWGFQRPHDRVVLGFTVEEKHRQLRVQDNEPLVDFWPVLIDAGVTKARCFEILYEANIPLPLMYRLGYRNNNCIGCVKGQAGYWNKIRKDFPERFAEMARLERDLGRTICKRERQQNGVRSLERIYLDEMPPDLGRYESEPPISCGILCQNEADDG